jgi:hypothetical protein
VEAEEDIALRIGGDRRVDEDGGVEGGGIGGSTGPTSRYG